MDASKKRLRSSSPSIEDDTLSSPDAQRSKLATAEGYHSLPTELQRIIIDLACSSSPCSEAPSSSSRQRLLQATATMRNLSLVCRQMHEQVTPLLWRSVTITRPSSLYALHQALVANPDRSKLILSLHIGPQDVLPANWWPLRLDRRGVATSLEGAQLPSQCNDNQFWDLDAPSSGCRQLAILKALGVAQRRHNISLRAEDFARTNMVGAIFEVQAALDLYLGAMKSFEEVKEDSKHLECHGFECDHYPALVMGTIQTPSLANAPPTQALILHRTQLLRHLARPGSSTDRFDHPILFVRSGFKIDVATPSEKQQRKGSFRGAQYTLRADHWDMVRCEKEYWHGAALLQQEDRIANSTLNIAPLQTGTIGAILSLARSILSFTSRLHTLSLTGFLQHTLDGHQELPWLRNVSLGPPPPRWRASLPLAALKHVQALRVCGSPLTLTDVRIVTKEMPKLEELEWGLVDKLPRRTRSVSEERAERPSRKHRGSSADSFTCPLLSLNATRLDILLHRLNSDHTLTSATDHAGSQDAETESSSDSHASVERSAARCLVRLHPKDVFVVLAAVSADTRTAWLGGHPVSPSARPLKLTDHPRVVEGCPRSTKDNTSPVWGELFEEGMEWRARHEAR